MFITASISKIKLIDDIPVGKGSTEGRRIGPGWLYTGMERVNERNFADQNAYSLVKQRDKCLPLVPQQAEVQGKVQ